MVMDVISRQPCVKYNLRKVRFVCSELGKGTRETVKYLFRAANVWWRCAQYFVIVSCG